MKKLVLILIFLLICLNTFSQDQNTINLNNRKGEFYFYWGWNWSRFTKSNITFTGDSYAFTLDKVVASDRPSKFEFGTYFNPSKLSTPQYNFRFGYFISHKYNISIGIDHMKYVVQEGQTVKISGNISETGTIYDGNYLNDDIAINKGFLEFEHTDGLNYLNFEFRRLDEIINQHHIRMSFTSGLGSGILVPKTNTVLLTNQRYDKFHLAGYGFSAVIGLNIAIYRSFFIQSELKGGYINMPDIRTTASRADKAKQDFFFSQLNIVFGATFGTKRHRVKSVK